MAAPRTAPPRARERPLSVGAGGPAARHIEGPVRLGRVTKWLAMRAKPGEVAVVDHADLGRLTAEELIRCGVACVVNVARSCTGRYPNEGPLVLAHAGVHLVDVPGAPLFDELEEGEHVAVAGGRLLRGGSPLAEGRVIDREEAARQLEVARAALPSALAAFTANTLAHLGPDGELLAAPLEVPTLSTPFRGRPALVVARGPGRERDLRALLDFVARRRPVLVGVDGGADLLLSVGLAPDVIVGDMDSASDRALACGAELLLHAYADGRAPGGPRLERLGLPFRPLKLPGTSEDAALLLAAELGARPVVSLVSPLDVVEFLDRARDGMGSTFLTRLRIGDVLVDGRGVSELLEA